LSQCGDLGVKYLGRFTDAPGNHEVITELYYSRRPHLMNKEWGHRFDRVRTAIYDWPYKYIRSTDGKHELYDLAADRTESNNLIDAQPQLADRLAARLEEFQESRNRRTEQIDTPPLTAEDIKQLKALGYLDD
jgi:hypothetical protein